MYATHITGWSHMYVHVCSYNVNVVNLCSVCVQWEQVEYFDNKIICDLVEEKHQGIIAVLVNTHPTYSFIYNERVTPVIIAVSVCVG